MEVIGTVLRRHRLRWFGHVKRNEDANWVKRCTKVIVGGPTPLADWARHGRAPNCLESMQGQGQVEESQREKADQPRTDWTTALKLT